MSTVDLLKGQMNSLNIVLLLLVVTVCLYRFRKPKGALTFLILTIVIFLIFSTAYLPAYVTRKLEGKFEPFNATTIPGTSKPVYIQVLGGGYTADIRLSATQQLSSVSLGRLAEAIRIHRLISGSKLVTSGYEASGTQSMAEVAALAARSLGVEANTIEMLSDATTTLEEAQACKTRFGTDITLILVTDAIHMPRAVKFFSEEGFDPIPAPTNFHIKKDDNISLPWMPSSENMLLMDRILREWFAQLKNLIL